MRNLNIVLSVMLVLCALGLVTSQHRARVLFNELERESARQDILENRWDELQIELTGLAKASLIDQKAREQLELNSRSAQRVMHLMLDQDTRSAARDATLRWRAAALGQTDATGEEK